MAWCRLTGRHEPAREFNALEPRDLANRERLLTELFGALGDQAWFEPPLFVAYGVHTMVGSGVYANTGLTLVDDGPITIGNNVMFAPHVTITATGHPLHPAARPHGEQFSAPVVIEDYVWFGSNVTILPGVTIGQGSVVAAGSVVTANVPPMVVVGGVPARARGTGCRLRPMRTVMRRAWRGSLTVRALLPSGVLYMRAADPVLRLGLDRYSRSPPAGTRGRPADRRVRFMGGFSRW